MKISGQAVYLSAGAGTDTRKSLKSQVILSLGLPAATGGVDWLSVRISVRIRPQAHGAKEG